MANLEVRQGARPRQLSLQIGTSQKGDKPDAPGSMGTVLPAEATWAHPNAPLSSHRVKHISKTRQEQPWS
jgi:hypothetical protein